MEFTRTLTLGEIIQFADKGGTLRGICKIPPRDFLHHDQTTVDEAISMRLVGEKDLKILHKSMEGMSEDGLINLSVAADVSDYIEGEKGSATFLFWHLFELEFKEITPIIARINSQNGRLDHLDFRENNEYFFEIFLTNAHDALQAAYYGEYNWRDEYVQLDSNNALNSYSLEDVEDEILHHLDEIEEAVRDYILETGDISCLDIGDYWSHDLELDETYTLKEYQEHKEELTEA